ncbi:receptor-type adenylate cyclase [Trypanosoma conorhini]|uniref:Receptor-type adenylate cyclase n=1 Tax=Trypanosoma conorhini TaxID=83891 RepID=A0A422MTX8_9TRYP|nr:receptor-type adenylate cyclase [Trypanosoma conorhini]RNE96646.1 receptor-type adenylate cyclase [Trypanosoma conorhini]
MSALPVLSRFDLVSFAPFTGSSAVNGWNSNMYFVRPGPKAELLALVRYAVAQLRVLRLGFMYLQDGIFGEAEYEQAERVLSAMGYEFCGVFAVKTASSGEADPNEFKDAWERFAATRPQAVIVFGSFSKCTDKFIETMLKDERTAGAYLLAPSAVQPTVLRVWRAAVADDGVKFVPGQVFATGTNPLANDARYDAIQRFQAVMRVYLENSGQRDYNDTEHFLNNDGDGELMVDGWIAGEVLAQALSDCKGVRDRKSFMESLFNQRRYLIDELVIGDYGGECEEGAEARGATCRCNQGGTAVYMKRFVEDYRAETLASGLMTFHPSDCNATSTYVPPVFVGVEFLMNDSAVALSAVAVPHTGFIVAIAGLMASWDEPEINMASLPSALADARAALQSELRSRRVYWVAGVVTEAMLDVEGVAFLDPLQLEPRQNRFRRHVIHLSPTLEQQFFVLAEYLRDTGVRAAHAVVRGEGAAAVAEVLRRSLVTFGGSLRSATLLAGGDALAGHLPEAGDVFVAGRCGRRRRCGGAARGLARRRARVRRVLRVCAAARRLRCRVRWRCGRRPRCVCDEPAALGRRERDVGDRPGVPRRRAGRHATDAAGADGLRCHAAAADGSLPHGQSERCAAG